jgi:hypothetical protein
MLKKRLKGGFAPPALSTLSQFELLSVRRRKRRRRRRKFIHG